MSPAEALIIGAGPVGLTLANLLGQAGVRTVVLERNPGTLQEPRAVSLDDEALRIIQSLGLAQAMLPNILLDGIEIGCYNGKGKTLFRLNPTQHPYGYPRVGLFSQPLFETALLENLSRFPHVEVRFDHTIQEISPGAEQIEVRGTAGKGGEFQLAGQYLVGCDGGKSVVRSAMGIGFAGFTYKAPWLVVDARGEPAKPNEISFYCDPQRPAVNMPLPRGHSRWEFSLLPGETENAMLQPDRIQSLLSPYLDPSSLSIIRKRVYSFHARIASRFQEGRVFLAGDAAHLMPPFGGQGLCSGLRDAQNLSWKLAAVLKKGAAAALLRTYPQERLPHARKMIRFSKILGSIIMQTSPGKAALRDLLLSGIRSVPQLDSHLREMKFKSPPVYHAGFAWKTAYSGRLTGRLLPQPQVRTTDGKLILLDELLGNGFSVIALGTEPNVSGGARMRDLLLRIQARYLHIAEEPSTTSQESVQDVERAFTPELRSGGPSLLLVRPDRFVAAQFSPAQSDEVMDFFDLSFNTHGNTLSGGA